MNREDAIELAHQCGDQARGGGGNVSVTVDGVLWIKPSGVSLSGLAVDDLVPLDTATLLSALTDDLSGGDPERIAARRARLDEGTLRPSVELLMHAVIEHPLVIHLHPVDLNAVTCATDGERLTAELFGDEACWVPYVNPGLPLARAIAAARAAAQDRTGRAPTLVMMGNHGITVSGETVEAVMERLAWAQKIVADRVAERTSVERASASRNLDAREGFDSVVPPSLNQRGGDSPSLNQREPETSVERASASRNLAPLLRGLLATEAGLPMVASDTSKETQRLLAEGAAVIQDGPLIPDQIVYAGSLPMVADLSADDPLDDLRHAVTAYRDTHGRPPTIVVVPNVGVFAVGTSQRGATTALSSFTDALATARDADRLGGVRVMTADERGYIENWEAESYRTQIASGGAAGRMAGRVALVTGAAQGFGLGIATELCRAGATVVLADLQADKAAAEAEALCAQFGAGKAFGVAVDVTDEASQRACVAAVVDLVGGLDLVVANAGIARAGSIFDQPIAEFDLVTSVNYRGYVLTVQAVAPVLAAQHRANPERWFDIVEINSKSGLAGSKANHAYAGSKFGGIGLTQSFALELVDAGIKVNAVCPGNYLDGPLWSDPERGLFVQYLNAGKVPGARTVDDVRRSYESKVPMARGCTPTDVARAVMYAVEQAYETGQAIPVTGGQVMLA